MKPQSSIFTDVQALRSSGEFSVDITLFFTTERYLYYQIINELGRVETLSTRCKGRNGPFRQGLCSGIELYRSTYSALAAV